VIILVDIERDPQKTIRELAERVPIKKTQVGERISVMEEIGLVETKGATSGARRQLTPKGREWLIKQGYLR
jgi:DNA-binding MarR family transcriptional regulator